MKTQNPSRAFSRAITKEEFDELSQRSVRIRLLLRKSASLWLEIAKEVNDAKNTLSKNAFDLFLQKSTLTQSIADKMPRIAQASILYLDESKQHLEKLEGWTTLYEVAKLPEADVREMYRELQKNPEQCLTRSFIQQFKIQQNSSQKPVMTIATITLSEDDVKRLDYNEYLRFRDALEAIQRIIDRSIIAARMTLHTKSLEKVEAIILQQSMCDADDNSQELSELIELRALPAANTDCSDISTQTH
jgi:hypothetical protein